MKNTKYHTVGTFPNPTEISSKEANSIHLTHIYMIAHFLTELFFIYLFNENNIQRTATCSFPGLVQAQQWKMVGLN